MSGVTLDRKLAHSEFPEGAKLKQLVLCQLLLRKLLQKLLQLLQKAFTQKGSLLGRYN
jgi:hypothetical protein